MSRARVNMTEGPLFVIIMRFTLPIILTNVLQLTFNAADIVMVGRLCGSTSVAAVGATGSVTNLLVNLFIGVAMGAGVTVAQGIGARDGEEVHKAVHTAMTASIICGLIMSVIGIVFSRSILLLMNTPLDVLDLAAKYVRIYFLGSVFSMVFNFGAAILRAVGESKKPLYYLTMSGVLNVCLNFCLIRFAGMDVEGVAIATITAQALSAFLVVRDLLGRDDLCKLNPRDMRIHKKQLKKIIRIGLPSGAQASLFSLSNMLIQSSVNSFGKTVLSANSAAGNIEGFLYAVVGAFQQTTINFTGQNLGARNPRRIRRLTFISIGAGAAIAGTLGILALVFGRQLLGIYITDDPMAIEYGLIRFRCVGAFYFVCAFMDIVVGSVKGLGKTTQGMIISLIGTCGFRVIWIYTVFARFRTLPWLYVCYPITYALVFTVQMIYFLHVTKKLIEQQDAAALQTT
ncbi:MAG: MATE family efflux transporter [Clostridia bacterium]|nr:MATE family efflux transporter [Clostridia bacterium]